MESLRQREGIAAKALEFTVLNAVRTSETRLAIWSEIDWDERVWSVPASRTKTKKLLRVALSEDALAILREVQALGSEWIFPNPSLAKPFSTNAMLAVLDRMGVKVDTTVHGFRSTFSDWAGETTDFPRDIVEMALGHKVGNAVERAYRRGDALERRRASHVRPFGKPASFRSCLPTENVMRLRISAIRAIFSAVSLFILTGVPDFRA